MRIVMGILVLVSGLALFGCRKEGGRQGAESGAPAGGGIIRIDGSSTVFPIAEAVAEEFQRANRGARVTVGVSGTGGGFKKFCNGETDITNASRPIKPTEQTLCEKNGVGYIEVPVAYDGIAVIVNPQNTWVDHLTVAELRKMWEPEAQGRITLWSQVRDGFPDEEIRLYGAGVDSGTYDYFTEAIVGKEHSSRGDYTSSEDDNVVVQGIAHDRSALGFFGFAYYVENKDKLKLVPIDDGKADNGAGPIAPSTETVRNGTYQPLSRPIFVYVSTKALDRPEVASFVRFLHEQAPALVAEVGYIPLPESTYRASQQRVDQRRTGSLFGGRGSQVGVSVEALMKQELDGGMGQKPSAPSPRTNP